MAHAQEIPASAPPPEQEQEQEQDRLRTLGELENWIAWQTRTQWQLREKGGALGVDQAGKSISAYAEEFIFTEAVADELGILRERAAQQSGRGDESGLRATLDRATAIAFRQRNQMNILASHFSASHVIAQHEALLAPLLARVPASERGHTEARLRSLRPRQDDLPERLRTAADDGLRKESFALVDVYNDERRRLAAIAAREDARAGRPLPGRDVARACTPPYSTPSGMSRPTLDTANLAEPAYEPVARRLGIEGNVVLRAWVSAQGCPERIELVVPLGYEPLDRSALDWGETVRFHPAVHDGQPVATVHEFSVTFRLTD